MVVVFERSEALHEAQGLSILKFVNNLEPAYWLKEARSTDLTLDQLNQVGKIVPLKIPQGSGPCKASNFTYLVTTLALHLLADKKHPGYSEPLETKLKTFKSVVFVSEAVQSAGDLLFRTFNIEHTGHNIA